MIPSLRKSSKQVVNKNNNLNIEEQFNYEQKEIIELIKQTKKDIDLVHNKYEFATEQCIIDSCIYELKALHLKYEYLLNEAKKFCS